MYKSLMLSTFLWISVPLLGAAYAYAVCQTASATLEGKSPAISAPWPATTAGPDGS